MKAYKLYVTDPPDTLQKTTGNDHLNFESERDADILIAELERLGHKLTFVLTKHGRTIKTVSIPRQKPKLLPKF